ncbi:MAG: adenylate/guanylate cyclase domain-containing protein [Alphaproteobacteria bacterium]|jgi:class 3 adenylate cyclase|nr:adenylate/guanylate cyclase domain-containing protein [Alphaproteobacteria bacterium]MDP6875320.1 adenylate/guanylate cyclase domain-containing protein [Alphaproteobacteria bacterium]
MGSTEKRDGADGRNAEIARQQAEIERLTEALHSEKNKLNDVVTSLQEGFIVFDREHRLVVCNDSYLRFYIDAVGQEVADKVVPGAYHLDFLGDAFDAGMFPDVQGTREEFIEYRRKRQNELRRAVEIRFCSGQWVQVNEHPTHDGGFVAVYTDITELKRREAELASKTNDLERLSNQLAKYLSPQIYQSIFTGKQEVKVASARKKLTVFFSDIAEFTATTDRLQSEELTALLNQYLTEMSDIALAHGATIDKFVGDAIMIFFGDPESRGIGDDALSCVKMSIAMRDRMAELKNSWHESGIVKPLRCRMGIHTDYCTVGNFGSDDRLDYTIIGGGVNLASRLESEAEPGEILISYETYAHIKDEIYCEPCGQIDVKGIAYPVTTYRVIDVYDRMDRDLRPLQVELPNFRMDMKTALMSPEESDKVSKLLTDALELLKKRKHQ